MVQERLEQPNQDLYNELAYYTLAHPDPSFIHQLVVDAYTAQNADGSTKPIAIAFALIGLYLHLEKGYSGRQVQQAHMRLANRNKRWPSIVLPSHRGDITAANVLAAPPGPDRDQMIERWCRSVWDACNDVHEQVRQLVQDYLYQSHR